MNIALQELLVDGIELHRVCDNQGRSQLTRLICIKKVLHCIGGKLKINPCELKDVRAKFFNIDFFLKILPLKDDELAMSEM